VDGALRPRLTMGEADRCGRSVAPDDIVFDDIELTRVYHQDAAGAWRRAEIGLPEEDPAVMEFE
jgi:hypothetical protein